MPVNKNRPFPKRPRLRDFDYVGTYAYFITILTKDRGAYFKEVEVVRCATDILLEEARSEKFSILAYCFMPDHLHLLVMGQDDRSNARKFVSLFKQKAGIGSRRITTRICGMSVIMTIS